MKARCFAPAALPLLALCLGCLTYDVEQREQEVARQEVDSRIDDLWVSLDPEGGASWVLEARFRLVADYEVQKRVEREPRFAVEGGITGSLLRGGGSASAVDPVWLLPFAAAFDVATFFLSVPPVWLAAQMSSRDGERTDLEAAGRWQPCERAVLGENDNPFAYLAPRLDDTGRSYLTTGQIRASGLRGRMWIVDCGGERESFSIPPTLWQQISAP